MISTVVTALGLGLAAGVSPGPLLVLVVTATLRGGLRRGLAVACVPLLSDAVVVGVTLLALGRMPTSWLAWLGVVGGIAVAAVGVQTMREARSESLALGADAPRRTGRDEVRRAIALNLVSPHPWISWLTFLGPLTVTAWRSSPAAAIAFVAVFYLMLVGAKAVLAVLVSRGRDRLTDTGYRRAVVLAGWALVALGVVMAVEFATKLV
ncbi:LysE family translocator [Dermacoccus barathri]|uniref:LysE family translocator n=1 Tax=Dermacoccus barathri TaxID=322601 RepID=UPI00187960CB|nr:LysE family transporter [Dermacoccus barathri]MBE7370361.1 LysE family transporter [Dermacoccus barathri]